MIVNLTSLLYPGANGIYIVPGFNIFGMDDTWAVIQAAEIQKSPVVIMVNKEMVRYFPVELLGQVMRLS